MRVREMHLCLFSEPMNSGKNVAMEMGALAIVKLIRIVIWSLTMAIDFTRLLVPVNISIKYTRSRKLDNRFYMPAHIL